MADPTRKNRDSGPDAGPGTESLTDLAGSLARESGRTARALAGLALHAGRQVTRSVEDVAGGVGGGLWQRAGSLLQTRMTRLLNTFQIPTHRDVRELNERVDKLTRAVDRLSAPPRRSRSGSRQRSAPSRARAR